MEEKYPVMIDGELKGVLTVRREGVFTVFEVSCVMMEGIRRISVYGEDGEGYLGVLLPENDKLVLRKRLSRNDMRGFPKNIIDAGLAGQGQAQPAVEIKDETGTSMEEIQGEVIEEVLEETVPQTETVMEQDSESAKEAAELSDLQKDSPDKVTDTLTWYSSPDGALVCFDGENSLLALPLGDMRIPSTPQGEPRSIEGREYLVYITKNLRILD